ncbi:Na+/H+ antiporter subunit A [Microbacterium sp.]|uniref:Na+/H+ antiporter subunit A n=1 Tax=Microbacterium sp. TaxID=51671 RepID=UPI0025EEEB82|nr:Na+/H+ antiporter subunit A [Microbacterium sp.]
MLILLGAFALVPLTLPWLIGRLGPRAFFIAALLPLAAFIHTLLQTPAVLAGKAPFETYAWIPQLGIDLSMRMDTLGWVMALIVTGVGALVMIYCRWYFTGEKQGVGFFSAVLLGFAGAMYGLVLADDLIVLVMLWEVTSILSYLLIGFYHRRGASRRAALQALLVTTLGGLVMFVGAVIVSVQAGTSSISQILHAWSSLEQTVSGPLLNAAVVMLLIGALSKSAIFPFHFWLPGAMAAPTPVSAYLHAAAMVKAGIYFIARFAPFLFMSDLWRPIVISLGIFTMLLGGLQALRESDLKRILAFGTVSQLGMLTAVLGYGVRDTALAGLALLIGHALFKSALFLVVGVIDRQLSTRDIGGLSGVGRQAPTLAALSMIAVASMIGVAPTIGFVAKEATLTAFIDSAATDPWALVALIGIVLGSVLTAAYGLRFIWGAFWTKKDAGGAPRPVTVWPDPPIGFLAAPLLLAGLTLALGFAAPGVDALIVGYADQAADAASAEHPYHLALWHGLEPALFLSLGSIALGFAVFFIQVRRDWTPRRILRFSAADLYNNTLRGIARVSTWTTTFTQRGSLPLYVATILVVFVAAEGTALIAGIADWNVSLDGWQTPMQVVVAPIMIVAGLAAVRARKRYTGVVLVSVTGLGMVLLFATSGAPDLALTQILIETVTLVTFALVLRRIPARLGEHNASVWPIARAVLAVGVGATMAFIAVVATGARVADPISDRFPELAYELGHGKNVVNVALVDLRGWDTMGELSVLILAATGVASLVFVTHRSDLLSRAISPLPTATTRRPLVETDEGPRPRSARPDSTRQAWLVGGQRMRPENRSIMLEVIVRILFHTIIVVSLYLLFAGHNLPGGGFAGGLVAGMALVMRYVAGGRYELGAAAPTDAGRLLGVGMTLAVATALAPLLFGAAPLTSGFWEADLPVIGHVEFVTSTIFDVGVYLVVIGLVLDVLRSLGGEVDRQAQALRLMQGSRPPQGGRAS